MRYRGAAYRGHHPKWAFDPVSGEGAAVHGGRFNPKGVETLYLSTSPEGAFLEATQGFAYKFNPLTLCAYAVDCTDIIDLTTDSARDSAGISFETMGSPWFFDLSESRRPESWTVYDQLHESAAGLLVPSFAVGATSKMTNLILWNWSKDLPHKVLVHDPDRRLPHSQKSWEADE